MTKRFEFKEIINRIGLPEGKQIQDNLTGNRGLSIEDLINIANEQDQQIKELTEDNKQYGDKTMSIDLKHSFILQKQIKNAVRTVCNQVISEIDKDQELHICKRGFEIMEKNGKKYQITLEIKER